MKWRGAAGAAALVVLGAVLEWLLSHVLQVKFEPKLGFGEALNAFVTLLVAWTLAVLFQRAFVETRAEKELLIAQAREVGASIGAARALFHKAFFDGTSDRLDQEILTALRLASVHLTALAEACSACGLDYKRDSLAKIQTQLRRYRKDLTARARSASTPYSTTSLIDAESTYALLHQALLMFLIRVNKG